jgi:NAD(P)H-flavin reductase
MRVNISPMKNGQGQLSEIYLDSRARILCPPGLVPAPGQYVLAHADSSDDPLAVPIFFSDSAPNGFRCAPSLPLAWRPGMQLNLRGPLGHGFSIPAFARKVALIEFAESPARLYGLISIALKQDAEVVLTCDTVMDDIPEAVEVQPLQALVDIYQWADYAALDVARENLHQIGEMLGKTEQAKSPREAQVLVRAPMPCGAIAECGVCALTIRREWKMICKDGPVFEMSSIFPHKKG